MFQTYISLQLCLQLDANERPTCSQLLRHDFFTHDGFAQSFPQEIKAKIQHENHNNPLLRHTGRRSSEKAGKENQHTEEKEGKEVSSRKKKKEKDKSVS